MVKRGLCCLLLVSLAVVHTVPAESGKDIRSIGREGRHHRPCRCSSWLRHVIVNESRPNRGMGGQGNRVGLDGPWDIKRVLGTVPIEPWYGKVRGFSFIREVQPVLDRYCVGCHNGEKKDDKGRLLHDFRDKPAVKPAGSKGMYLNGSRFTPSYMMLRAYVRTPTMESDMHLNAPCEWHADTTTLFQMLNKGYHNVQLDAEAWDRLVT